MIRVLLDTHVLLWAWVSPEKLSPEAMRIIKNPANRRFVSAVTAFEIATKFKSGKLDIESALVYGYSDHLSRFMAEELPLLSRHGLAAGRYASHHRDPFDRLLAAQSDLEGIPLITRDACFQEFPVQTIW